MKSVICTLFEGHYHYGVAALANSLYQQGYRGNIYAGYRGPLPAWSGQAKKKKLLNWDNVHSLEVADGLHIHFLLLETDYHLTNYKPEFMLRVWDGPARGADAIAYFDPDIVVKSRWNFYERWMSHGVALVHEITSNDMPPTHPIRLEWDKVIRHCNKRTERKLSSYINGGFCGVSKKNIEFLSVWLEVMKIAIENYDLVPSKFMPTDRTHIFFASDQDALNITAMCSKEPISEVGPEGMDFIHGGWIMSHAVGSPKPWKKRYVWAAINGNPPSLADRKYWQYVDGPILCYNSIVIKLKKISILIAAFIGRIYRRF